MLFLRQILYLSKNINNYEWKECFKVGHNGSMVDLVYP